MPKVWVVRADAGKLMDEFESGGFASIGFDMGDLTGAKTSETVRKAYDEKHPRKLKSAAANVSAQIHAFMNEMDAGDVILTPTLDAGVLRFGELNETDAYFQEASDGHRHVNRRRVCWSPKYVRRARLPDNTRSALRNVRTVFLVSEYKDEFLAFEAVREASDTPYGGTPAQEALLERILQKNPGFFELLIAELLTAMGCTESDVQGGPGDGGIDVTTQVAIPFVGDMKMIVQAKRLRRKSHVNMHVIRRLRDSLEEGERGLVITTAEFSTNARERTAEEAPGVHLVDGPALADELAKHWDTLPRYFQDQLGPLPTDPIGD